MSFDEITNLYTLDEVINVFKNLKTGKTGELDNQFEKYKGRKYIPVDGDIARKSLPLQQDIFSMKYSETNMMRYIQRLDEKDVSLTDTMIPLGSCTMKLNSAICMIPVTWYGFANLHPFAPLDQA